MLRLQLSHQALRGWLMRLRRLLLVVFFLLGFTAILAAGLVAAPAVDERTRFFTSRAIGTIQSYEVEGVPLSQIIDTRFQGVRWRAYHQDSFMQTFVECVGTPRSGGPSKRLLWFVEERPAWTHWPPFKSTVVTGLNNDALLLAPKLFDPRAGFGLEQASKSKDHDE